MKWISQGKITDYDYKDLPRDRFENEIISNLCKAVKDLIKIEVTNTTPDKHDSSVVTKEFTGELYIYKNEVMEEIIFELEGLAVSSDEYITSRRINEVVERLKRE